MTTESVRSCPRGMTLVEVVIALAILGMIATLALGGLRLGVRTWETVGQRVETESHAQIVRAFLRRTLAQATPVLEIGTDRKPRPVFRGDGESLSMVAPLAEYLGLGGLQRLEFGVEDQGRNDGYRLVMTRALYYPPRSDSEKQPNEGEKPERHVLIEDAARIEFEYLRDLGDGQREWSGQWTGETEMPLAIKLAVEPLSERVPASDLVVPLRITMAKGRR